MTKMNNKFDTFGDIGMINTLGEIDVIKSIVKLQIYYINDYMKMINDYFDNPGLIDAHRQINGQVTCSYGNNKSVSIQRQLRANQNWHDAECGNLAESRKNAISELKKLGIATSELAEQYLEQRVYWSELTKRCVVNEKLNVRYAEIVEQEKLQAEIIKKEKFQAVIVELGKLHA